MAALLEVAQYPTRFRESTGSVNEVEAEIGHRVGTQSSRMDPGSKARILIVDDDAAVREILAELLEDDGYCSIMAGDAVEALLILRREGAIDALVTDLTMPGDDGIALIRKAREIDSTLPAILLTGYAEQLTSNATTAGGHFHVLRKPVHIDRLIEQLRLLVAKPAA
jgi:DNA-binding NtrC family response regulator